ncbi:MAG: PEGA domain-containing protein, partial [Lachnospiraceae bacterium]|nr:PEGA domain-containing protein [Lachnospiraceae bacterium]
QKKQRQRNIQKKARAAFVCGILLLYLTLLLSGCAGSARKEQIPPVESEPQQQTGPYERPKADSLDEAVISRINERKQTITFYNTQIGRSYTLSYKGISSIKDKYDEELSVSQLSVGDVVITSFVKEDKELRTIQLKKDAFVTAGVSNYEINKTARTMRIDEKRYQLSKYLFVRANGQSAGLEDISPVDVLRVSGTDRLVSSIVVEKGHGYIRLSGEEYFVGGWIEVGENLIKPISEGMLLTVPEGEYDVTVTNKGYGGSRHVVVEANKETTVDVSDLKGDEVKTGRIIFTVTPASAVLSVDGKEADLSGPVTLEYGIHQIVLKADGYKTLIKYIKVSSALANINIEMEAGSDDAGSVSGNNSQGASVTVDNRASESDSKGNGSNASGQKQDDNGNSRDDDVNTGTSFIGDEPVTDSSDGARVYIDAPKGAQLYLDGAYIGVVPTNFPKESGNHEVSFRKDGYQTRSYTLYFDDGDNNLTFSFADLLENDS